METTGGKPLPTLTITRRSGGRHSWQRQKRDGQEGAPATFDFKLALGRADAMPEARVKVTGFKDEIDATTWLIAEVTHNLDKSGGFSTSLKLEVAPWRSAAPVRPPFPAA